MGMMQLFTLAAPCKWIPWHDLSGDKGGDGSTWNTKAKLSHFLECDGNAALRVFIYTWTCTRPQNMITAQRQAPWAPQPCF